MLSVSMSNFTAACLASKRSKWRVHRYRLRHHLRIPSVTDCQNSEALYPAQFPNAQGYSPCCRGFPPHGRMKIALIIHELLVEGGGERQCVCLARALANRGSDVTLWTS